MSGPRVTLGTFIGRAVINGVFVFVVTLAPFFAIERACSSFDGKSFILGAAFVGWFLLVSKVVEATSTSKAQP